MKEITLKAYAKINLSLEVTGRRSDGYHDIRSLMQGIGLYDVISLTICPGNGTKYNLPHCTIDGIVVYLCTDAKTIPVDMSNLAFKGIKAVLDVCADRCFGLEDDLIITIDKRLPVAAGIAGGSGNAAACMLGLNALLGSPFTMRELMEIGTGVGADVPFSIIMNAARNRERLAGLSGIGEASPAAWISGIGDIVIPAQPMQWHVIMANPGIAVSTKDAYEAIDAIQAAEGKSADVTAADDPSEWPLFVNDLEKYTLAGYPEASRLRSIMENELRADTVLMSGSGPTMVAYYGDIERALEDFGTMQAIADREDNWRVWLTTTGDPE